MKETFVNKKASLLCALTVVCGVACNVLFSTIIENFGLPVYLDTMGTIAVACLCGYFPGILTGVSTNIVKYFSYANNPYYAILSGFIAVITTSFYYRKILDKFSGKVLLVISLAFVGGVPGAWVSWLLEGSVSNTYTLKLMQWLQANLNIGFFASDAVACFIYDLADKIVCVTVAMVIVYCIPENIKNMLRYSGLRQEYVPVEVREISRKNEGRSLKKGTIGVIGVITIASVLSMSWVSYMLYGRFTKDEAAIDAKNAITFAIDRIDVEELRDCVEKGKESLFYDEIKEVLEQSKYYTPKMSHIYMLRLQEDGVWVLYDLVPDGETPRDGGILVDYDEEFSELYEMMGRHEEISGLEMKSSRGWNMSVMEPVIVGGKFLCYIGGDIDLSDIRDYQNTFLARVLLITLALLMVTMAFGLRMAMNRLIFPLNSLTYSANAFVFDSKFQRQDEEVRQIMKLKINTRDEIEKLYNALKKMMIDSIAHEKSIRKQAQTIAEMQSGLILILADMVENRDSDTGNHTKRTSYYVRAIMEGLKRKGYYLDQLTDQYVADVTQSAPLHDIGKIGISDTILNKPGKLTEEEFNEMKRHTKIGKELMERAISEIHGESYLYEARNLAAYHHEKWNGKGYPEGLSGEDIPLSARIMAIADVFDAVSQKRVYKEAFSFEQSVAIIEQDSGISFDPKCVEAFMDSLDEIRKILENGELEGLAV